MSNESKSQDWSKPAAIAIPKGGFFNDKVELGRYGPIFPKSPACYGFSILAKVIPGREDVFYKYAQDIEKTVAEQPDCLAVLKLHYLRWVLLPIKGETYFRVSLTPTSTNIPKTQSRFSVRPACEPCSRTSKASRWTGRPTPQHS